ncbi:MAG: carboxypeptidase regulatory-like domain-containing protein [Bacteroidales bacterium]|nr:carboxypeptidase regulatory-like domain-containing protein [Bacteroidales bacterium]
MKKFTRLLLMMMTIVFSISVIFVQAQKNVSNYKQLDAKMLEKKMQNAGIQQQIDVKKDVQKIESPALSVSATFKDVELEKVTQQKQMKSSVATEMDPKSGSPAPPSDFLFDLQFEYPLTHPDGLSVGIETDGNYIYLCHWQNGNYYRYDMSGNYLATFTIAGTSLIRDMAYNPNTGYFYGAAATTTVWEMDFTPGSEALVSTIIAPTAIRAIGCDHDNNLLFGNNWSTAITFFDLTGALQYSFPVGPTGASYYGLAYDDYSTGGPFVWGYAQIDVSLEWLVQMDAVTGVETGVAYDVGTALGHVGTIAGGLAITPPGTFPGFPTEWSLFGITQNTSMWAVELGPPNPCSTPVSLSATNIMDTQADLGWTETGTSTTWEIELREASVPFTGTPTHTGITLNPYTMTGLTTLTSYHWKVRADCGSGSYSGWSAPNTFGTTGGDCMWECVGYDSYGDGWNLGSIDFYVDGGLVGNWAGPATTGPESYFFPILDPCTIDIVWNPGSWDSEVTYEIYDNFGGLQFSDGPNPTGTTGLPGWCTPPACPPPTALMTSNLTGTTALASWSDANSAGLYDIVWGETGFDPDTGPFTGTAYGVSFPFGPPYQYTLTGLSAAVSYEWAVRSDCGTKDLSIWAKSAPFVWYPVPANDECVNAILVGGSGYPETVLGTTLGATIDCPGVLDWEAVWYELDLPYASNSVSLDYCGTPDQATIGIVYYPDCSDCNAYVIADFYEFYDCGTPGGVTVGRMDWFDVPGPGTIRIPVYQLPLQDFVATFDVTEFSIPQGATCADPLLITLPADLPYLDAGQTTCGMINDYTETCLGSYDGGEDIIYELTVTSDVIVDILLDPLGTTWTGILIDETCPPGAACIAFSTMSGSTPHGFTGLSLTAGTYYIMIDTWPSPTCIPAFDLTINSAAPTYDLDGTVTYYNNGIPMDYINVTLDDGADAIIASTITDGSGNYQFTGIPAGTYTLGASTIKPRGGENLADVNLIVSHLLGNPLTGLPFLAADVDASGDVGLADYNLLVSALLGNIAFTSPDWFFGEDLTVVLPVPPGEETQNFEAISSGDPSGDYLVPPAAAGLVCDNAPFIDISTLPTSVTGNTADGLIWSSLPFCDYSITAPGEWWTFTGTGAELVVDLCTNTTWDTKLHIFSGACDALVCVGGNDDYCGLQSGLQFVSTAGVDYFVLVNGYSSSTGDYELTISEVAPCSVTCPPGSTAEGEAPIPDDGEDVTNGGCNSTPNVFGSVTCGETVCGTAGFYLYSGSSYRDTDWYELDLTGAAVNQNVTVEFEGEFLIQGYILSGNCAAIVLETGYLAQPCEVGSMTAVGLAPGVYWIFMGPDFGATANWDDYYFTVTCEDTPSGTYCTAGSGLEDEYIVTVDVGTIAAGPYSPDGATYHDYTAVSTNMTIGVGYPITVVNGTIYTGDQVTVWVDWNQDADFDDAGETFTTTTVDYATFNGTITPPAGALTGMTRMRIRLNYTETPLPCGNNSYGEVHDYSVNVQ